MRLRDAGQRCNYARANECHAFEKGRPTGDVLKEWDERGITQCVLDNYLQYHTEAIENACAGIDSMLETGRPAW